MTALLIGHARVPTDEQDLTAQRDTLASLGVTSERVYVDHGLISTNRDLIRLRTREGIKVAKAKGACAASSPTSTRGKKRTSSLCTEPATTAPPSSLNCSTSDARPSIERSNATRGERSRDNTGCDDVAPLTVQRSLRRSACGNRPAIQASEPMSSQPR